MSISASPRTQDSFKRKWDETEEITVDRRPFTIRLDSSDLFARPPTLTPFALLDRAKLPLAYLDTTTTGTRIFSAYIDALEKSFEHSCDATVLLALEQTENRIYAIERVARKKYALCRLVAWARVSELENGSKCLSRYAEASVKRQALQPVENCHPWWINASVDIGGSALGSKTPLANLATGTHAGQGLHGKPSLIRTAVLSSQDGISCVNAPIERSAAAPVHLESETTSLDTLQDLAKSYLETLYLSRTSLAYFAKGPLSRARAAFAGTDNNMQLENLVAFLRVLVLSPAATDRKYRDGIVEVVKELSQPSSQVAEKAKKKRKFKGKRDKAGFLPDEKDFVVRWWQEGDETVVGVTISDDMDAAFRRRLSQIRKRETFLQLILVLELLALEHGLAASSESFNSETAPGGGTKATGEDSTTPAAVKKTRTKGALDLSSLLDTLIDKLCIWFSLDTSSPAKKDESGEQQDASVASDELRDFCIEVIIPFYIPRISHYASTVNKKLGGPSAPTPVKRKVPSSGRPGQPAVRHAPPKEAKRASAGSSSTRLAQTGKSTTTSRTGPTPETMPRIKREGSEVSLGSIPVADPLKPAPRQRTSLMHSMSFNKREVDLSAMSQANEVKMRKKAEIQARMQEAISNIKKPNRALAVKEIAESTDESFARATARGRPSNPQRPKSTQQRVHVVATPAKHARTTKSTPYRRTVHVEASSGASAVTSSSTKPADNQHRTSSTAIPQTGHRSRQRPDFAETPSRGFAKFMPTGLVHQPGTLDLSPIAARRTAAVEQTPSRPVRSIALPSLRKSNLPAIGDDDNEQDDGEAQAYQGGVSATPLRVPVKPPALVDASPNTSRGTPKGESEGSGKSIYAALGWEDEEYDELA